MIIEFAVKGYRSLQDISITLDNLNIITGPNGCGKSNLYNAIHLLARSAEGSLAWLRFYHHFRTDIDSPLRRPHVK